MQRVGCFFRTFAHALCTALALCSWGGVFYIWIWHGSASDPLRMLGLSLLALAAVTTGTVLVPPVFMAHLGRNKALTDTRGIFKYGYWIGWAACEEAAEKERLERRASLKAVP